MRFPSKEASLMFSGFSLVYFKDAPHRSPGLHIVARPFEVLSMVFPGTLFQAYMLIVYLCHMRCILALSLAEGPLVTATAHAVPFDLVLTSSLLVLKGM